MRLIDADALYEKTAEWEARALAVAEKLNRKPFEEMDVNEITEWRKWSCILNERSAFKHDVADAPTVEPQQWIPISSNPITTGLYLVLCNEWGKSMYRICAYYSEAGKWIENGKNITKFITHWMPLPEPYQEATNEG